MCVLPDIDDLFARLVGLTYLCIVALLIMFREWVVSRNTASSLEQKIYSFSTFVISYCSGSALSFVFVYTLRSGALSVSWPLFFMLVTCIITNEFVSTHSFRFNLDVGVLLIATLFYVVFNTPIILKVENNGIFLLSVVVSMAITLIYVYFLQFTSENAEAESSRSYALAIGIPMFVGMLYFLNAIPAVPLSLNQKGVYHYVVRNDDGSFDGRKETDTRMFARVRTPVYHMGDGETGGYFFSAVDAPAALTAPLSHEWERYDTGSKQWVTEAVIPFTLAGGRDNGYRAYSYKEGLTPGLWRVTVQVDTNRIIGRETFRVEKSLTNVDLKEGKL